MLLEKLTGIRPDLNLVNSIVILQLMIVAHLFGFILVEFLKSRK